MVTDVEAAAELVLIVKVAVVAPAKTVTLGGTMAVAASLLAKVITASPVGAGAFNVTVPVEEAPGLMLFGLTSIEDSVVVGPTVVVKTTSTQ
jgi:hypothetical protein